jgi:drug/metabolite transporter (DMT)-like permease
MATTQPLLAGVAPAHPPIRLSRRALAVLALCGANLIWAGSPAASKAALAEVGPLTMGACRAGIAVVVLALLLGYRRERPATGRAPAVLGVFGVALFCAFQNYGLQVADATTTALIGGAKPVLIALLAVTLLGERLTGMRLGGLGVSMVGVTAIVVLGGGTPAAALGNLLPLAGAVAFSLYAVLSRRAFGAGNALPVVAGATGYGFLFLLPVAAAEVTMTGAPALSGRGVLLLLYLGVGCSAVAFILCGYGFARLEAAQAGAFANLKPLAGVALGMALLGEPLTLVQVAGGALVLTGVALAGRQRPVRWRSARIPRPAVGEV